MKTNIQLLDCTLRDGAYITGGDFGVPAIIGLIKKLTDAKVDIIECGWLKNPEYAEGSSYYHVPSDLEQYLRRKDPDKTYVAMIDWDRYDLDQLPVYDGRSLDAIRVVFPHGKHREGIAVAEEIKKKGYKVFLQAANTLAYSDEDLMDLAKCVNRLMPVSLSVVDTFGAMYPEDLNRITSVLDSELDNEISIGFHSHNNMQMSFALTMNFVDSLFGKRNVIVDSSLCGMGRGAGNAPTELVVSFLNKKYNKDYDMNDIMDAIDLYMVTLQQQFQWGYSIPYFIAGMYQCHVNNIAYLQVNHRTNSKDMRSIIESLSTEERRKYDYDLLESKYVENQNRKVNDEDAIAALSNELSGKKVLLIGPGITSKTEADKVKEYIRKEEPKIIFVNALNPLYKGDYLFLINSVRYDYAREVYNSQFKETKKILLSSVKTKGADDEFIINFDSVIKRGWERFDNAIVTCLRLMRKLSVKHVGIVGFDAFSEKYNESYADPSLPTVDPTSISELLNKEIQEIFDDFLKTAGGKITIDYVTTCSFTRNEN